MYMDPCMRPSIKGHIHMLHIVYYISILHSSLLPAPQKSGVSTYSMIAMSLQGTAGSY
jgi:hypothetical protein